MGCMVLELDVVVCVNCIVLKLLFVKGVRCVRVVMSGNCGAWELKTVSYVDGKWCVGNLVCGGFSVSNYLQGNLGTRRHDRLILAGKVPQICQAQAEGEFRGVWKRKLGRSEEEGVNGKTC